VLKENKLINLFYPKNTYTNMSKSNIMAYVCQSFVHVFQVGLLHLISLQNFSSVPFVFCWFFAWIALGDVDWHFSLILLKKSMPLKGELHHAREYINIISPYTWMMAWQTLYFLLASNTRQASTDHVCQITLNWKLLYKLEKLYKFSKLH